MSSNVIENVFFMLGGIAVLMFGMKIMGSNLEQVAGNNMKKMLGKMTNNRFAGVGVGAAVTAIINSSTATTVMLVGFVNVGLMSLTQATSVIMGANIGTTITAQILSLTGAGFEVSAYAALIAATGIVITMLAKKDRLQKLGYILLGIGLIFIGLKIMSMAVDGIIWEDKENKVFKHEFFRTLFQGDTFPLLLILIGAVLTALVHSSAAVTGILIALGSALNFQTAVFIILGSNIGTCVTSIVSSVGTNTNAKRTALIHLLFNVIGCVICIAPLWIWNDQIAEFMHAISGNSMERTIANFHTIFNLGTTIVLLPFVKFLVFIVCKIIPDGKDAQEEKHKLTFIDRRFLETPPIAVENTKKEILKMADIAIENVNLSMEMLLNGEADNSVLIKDNEDALNFLNKSITAFLTELMGKELTSNDEKTLGTYYHVVSDIERVGDYAENVMEYSYKLRAEEGDLSDSAKSELEEVKTTINSLFAKSILAFSETDASVLPEIDVLEESVDVASTELEAKHIERLKKGACTAQIGSIYLQTISDLERVGDHITNIGYSIRHYRHR